MLRRRKEGFWDGVDRRAPATVLVVNDDRDACEMLVRFVARAGYRALGANSESQASGVLMRELPRCIVLDLAGGGVGANLKVLDLIRSHDDPRVNTARVVLCAASPKNRSFSFQSGADSFLVRPFHIDDLLEQVDDILARPQDDRARHRRDELTRHKAGHPAAGPQP